MQCSASRSDCNEPSLCDYFSLLPEELSVKILRYFDFVPLVKMAVVSSAWRDLVSKSVTSFGGCESRWKNLYNFHEYLNDEETSDGNNDPLSGLQKSIEDIVRRYPCLELLKVTEECTDSLVNDDPSQGARFLL